MRSVRFSAGLIVGMIMVYLSLQLSDEYRNTESNLLLGGTFVAGLVLAWNRRWRALGVGLLVGLAAFVLFLVFVGILSIFIELS